MREQSINAFFSCAWVFIRIVFCDGVISGRSIVIYFLSVILILKKCILFIIIEIKGMFDMCIIMSSHFPGLLEKLKTYRTVLQSFNLKRIYNKLFCRH